jgi:hypothetical protein
MSETRERRYIAHITERATTGEGMGIFTTYGYLTPCGEWVEIETISLDKQRHQVIRHKADRFWCETSAQAMAAKAAKIRAIARRMLDQADELEAAAAAEKVTT